MENNCFWNASIEEIEKAKLNNVNKKELKDIRITIDNNNVKNCDIYETDNKNFAVKIKLEKTLSPTLYGEYSLREKRDSYFNISKNEIGQRKSEPHVLKIQFDYMDRIYIEEFLFDTIDTYLSNVNTKINTYKPELLSKYQIEEWIKTFI